MLLQDLIDRTAPVSLSLKFNVVSVVLGNLAKELI